jgi:hypothetical protein
VVCLLSRGLGKAHRTQGNGLEAVGYIRSWMLQACNVRGGLASVALSGLISGTGAAVARMRGKRRATSRMRIKRRGPGRASLAHVPPHFGASRLPAEWHLPPSFGCLSLTAPLQARIIFYVLGFRLDCI